MVQAFKHLSIRLWASILVGGLIALIVLPPLAGNVGPEFMIVPAFFLIAIAYWLIGRAFTSLGRRRLGRLLGEAAVWERAGMLREAHQTLTRAENTLLSYYFSPFSRKTPARQLLAQSARFRLSQSHGESSPDALVDTYLRYFPHDREAAIKWLEWLLARDDASQQSYEIASGIGSANSDDMTVQRLLARFYLAEGCCDFAALRTYRQLVDGDGPMADDLLNDMIDLFLSQHRADYLAFTVYVTGHGRGRKGSRLMAGIAACCRLVHPTPLTRPLLQKAETIMSGIDPSKRQAMASSFLPQPPDIEMSPSPNHEQIERFSIGELGRRVFAGMVALGGQIPFWILSLGRLARRVLASRQTTMAIKWGFLGLFTIGVGWLLVSTAMHLTDDFKPVETVPEPVTALIDDPFTLQVAAFLQEGEALDYVDQLKKNGLDAYWNRTTGNNKTWYQVRVSHFKSKDEARSMGEILKTRGLIDDYYVANYK